MPLKVHFYLLILLIFFISFSFCKEKTIIDSPTEATSVVDYVYPLLDAANSRWFYFSSASRPFGMVNLSPDTELNGAWGSGYRYDTDTIKGFSHIHAWQISGPSAMPVINETNGSDHHNFSSHFKHDSEKVEVGYHAVFLERYNIKVELTSSKRVGFHQYTFPEGENTGVVFKLNGPLGPSKIQSTSFRQIDDYTIVGQLINLPTRRRPKNLSVFYYVKFDQPITQVDSLSEKHSIVRFGKTQNLKMKVALSYTSIENAALNMKAELNHWDFDRVVKESKLEWNELLSRIQIEDNDEIQVRRFYTDLWHSLQGRRIINDFNGDYPDNTGKEFRIGKIPLNTDGTPQHNHYNSDSFWGAQWTLTTLWGLVYPEIYNEFANSLLLYYRDGGLIPRGPSGGNYTYVMTGASTTPFIVSAYQKGIRNFNIEEAYQGLVKNHQPEGIMAKSGYDHYSFSGGGLKHYLKLGYVPYPIPEGYFGFHQDGASLTLEYAYQDWTLAQLSKALGKTEDHINFLKRSENFKNIYDRSSSWMRPKDVLGKWKTPFDPHEYENGFNESNAAQNTWFVPHDLKGLAELIGSKELAVKKLNDQFESSSSQNFAAGTSHQRGEDPNRARIPINYGNQPSIQTAFIFSHLNRPDLTQYWVDQVRQKAFGGLSPYSGYNGDEDQGLMGALSVLMKIGLFQMTGGTEANPIYEITSPLFSKTTIDLPAKKQLIISTEGSGIYIDKILFNQKKIGWSDLRHDELVQGGTLHILLKEEPSPLH